MRDLTHTSILNHFQVIVTGDDIHRPKPDPEGLTLALGELSVEAHRALYLGDAVEDWEMAQAEGVPFIGVISQFSKFSPADKFTQVKSVEEILKRVLKPE